MAQRMEFDADSERAFHRRRDELVADFEGWLPAQFAGQVHGSDVAMLLDWKWAYGDGHLGRWRVAHFREFLLDWCPRKLVAPPDLLALVPSTVSLAMAFLADRNLLTPDSDSVRRLTEGGVALSGEFMSAMNDPANFGMTKSIFASMGIDDPSGLSAADLDKVMADFNAQPHEFRAAVTDPAMQASGTSAYDSEPLTLGPIRMPSDEAVRASAAVAPVLEVFGKISDYFTPPGRVLTAKGNLKMADARALVELLGTGDGDDPVVGDRVWQRRSATQFRELDHWQWWARRAGVVRRKNSRLVSVAAWCKRLQSDPVSTLQKAVDELFDHGLVSSYRMNSWPVEATMDVAASPLLGRLAQAAAPEPYDDLRAAFVDLLDQGALTEFYPGHLEAALDDLLTMLERAGLVVQRDVTRTEERFSARRSGGSVEITAYGIAFTVLDSERRGVEVTLALDPRGLDAEQLIASLEDDESPLDLWWEDVASWLDVQPDRQSAVESLLAAVPPPWLALTLAVAPEALRPTLLPSLRRMAPETEAAATERSAVALTWLLEHEPAACSAYPPEQLAESALLLLELLAAGDADTVVEMLSQGRDGEEQMQLLAVVARRGRHRGLVLLEVVGRSHPDRVVSKFARKEAFRLRSKLASTSNG